MTYSTPALGRLDAWLQHHRRQVILGLAIVAALLRGVYFVQFCQGPGIWQHHAVQTDMYFFDLWAKKIAGGDWLTNCSLHPLPPWMRRVSHDAMALHAELKASVAKESELSGTRDLDVVLWNRWNAGKCYNQEPLYAYAVAVTYALFGSDIRWVFVWQMFMGIGTVLLIYALSSRYFGALAGTLAGIFALLYAPLMYHELLLLRDAAIAFFTLLSIYTCSKAKENESAYWALLFGITAGLSLLLKGTFILYVFPALCVLGYLWKSGGGPVLRRGALCTLGMVLVMAPFVARNIYVGAPAFKFASPGGAALTVIVWDSDDYDGSLDCWTRLKYAPALMAETDGRFQPACIATLKTHDGIWSVARMILLKINAAAHWYEAPNNDNIYYNSIHARILAWLPISFLILAPLAMLGIALNAGSMNNTWPLYLALPASLAPLIVAVTVSRYRIPLAAAMTPFAGVMLAQMADWICARRLAALPAAAVTLLLALWVGRPLPAGQDPIRIQDYLGPCEYYYQPSIDAAMKSKDWNRAAELIESALDAEPDFIKNYPAHPLKSQEERLAARAYAWLHEAYSYCVKPEESARHLARAKELKEGGEGR